MAQMAHESGLKPIRENLYYTTVNKARRAFRTPFKNKSDAFVKQYLRNPEKMANYVYANRNGNGDEKSGDGWRFRAGGFIGITGKYNYILMSKDTRVDYVSNPDLLNNEVDALISALWYWNKNNLNKYADINDIDSISDIINIGRRTNQKGDANGFEHRLKLYKEYEAN